MTLHDHFSCSVFYSSQKDSEWLNENTDAYCLRAAREAAWEAETKQSLNMTDRHLLSE
jgi:hypothetical protein